ncbi:MAG: DUF6588 family protein [Spirochaetota bacterium]|nr:DUF6588 family protein [Spirochaetota bacterium]
MRKTSHKALVIGIVFLLLAGGAFAETFATVESSFSDFADDVAQALPQASTIGLDWSDARVRGFPHFGAGLTVGAVMMPKDAFEDLATGLGVTLPSEITDSSLGVPFPAYALDARLGLPILPFDVGAKLGLLTPEMAENFGGLGGVSADYMLAGIEVRYPLLKGKLALPAVALSAGYNYLSGGIATSLDSGDLGGTITGLPDGYSITFTDPDLRFAWKTHSFDFKVQASKNLLIFTPYIGGAYTYGVSKAGGGVSTDITYVGGTEDDVRDALEAAGYDVELDGDSFTIFSDANGGALRAFGGFSVNLLILKLDLNGQYNFTTQKLGAGLNLRVQF